LITQYPILPGFSNKKRKADLAARRALQYRWRVTRAQPRGADPELGVFLDRLVREYHQPKYLSSDPLEFVHRFQDPWDQEAVALVAALLAYGNVKQIRRSVSNLLGCLGPGGPAAFVRGLGTAEGAKAGHAALAGFVHRFNRGKDVALLLELLGRSWKEHGSLGAHFVSYLEPDAADFSEALNQLLGDWLKWAGRRARGSFLYFVTAPRDGSCCKRWCMFLRWMGRRDELDPGLWAERGALRRTLPEGRFLRPSQLVLPLDTHTGRISQYLALTDRKTLGWRAASEITARLRVYDSADPTRYDFALSRLGILDLCQRRYRAEICERCQLFTHCRFAREAVRRAARRGARV
jgi:uncharacterized protein (TIGR02757 family)